MKSKPHKWKSRRLPYYWMSFADGGKFFGVVIMRGRNALDCIRRAHALGINPGGQVLACEMKPEFVPPLGMTARLLNKSEVESIRDASPIRLGDIKDVVRIGLNSRLERIPIDGDEAQPAKRNR